MEASSTAVEQLTKETAALKESLCEFTDWADDSERSGKKGMRKPRRPMHANADSSPTSVESDSRLPPWLVPESDDNKGDGKDNAQEEARDKDVEMAGCLLARAADNNHVWLQHLPLNRSFYFLQLTVVS